MTEREITAVARAIYESHQFKKPWDHPDTIRLWHPTCKREARAAIAAFLSLKGKS